MSSTKPEEIGGSREKKTTPTFSYAKTPGGWRGGGHLPGTRGGRWRLKEFRAADSTRPGNRPPRSPCPRTGSFHSDGLIGRDPRTTSAPARPYTAPPLDSDGATRRP